MSDGAGYQAISYACVAALGAASATFTHFLSLCEALKNKPLCRLVFFFLSLSLGHLHAGCGRAHMLPQRVTRAASL